MMPGQYVPRRPDPMFGGAQRWTPPTGPSIRNPLLDSLFGQPPVDPRANMDAVNREAMNAQMRALGIGGIDQLGRELALFDQTPGVPLKEPLLLEPEPGARQIFEAYPFPTDEGAGPWRPPVSTQLPAEPVATPDTGMTPQIQQAMLAQQASSQQAPRQQPDINDTLQQLAQMLQEQSRPAQPGAVAQPQAQDSDILQAARYDSIVREASANNALLPMMAAAFASQGINSPQRRSERGEFDQLNQPSSDPVEEYRQRHGSLGSRERFSRGRYV